MCSLKTMESETRSSIRAVTNQIASRLPPAPSFFPTSLFLRVFFSSFLSSLTARPPTQINDGVWISTSPAFPMCVSRSNQLASKTIITRASVLP